MATTSTPQSLHIVADELYQLGNATSPKLDKVRPVDLVTYDRNGILMVHATGIGVSASTKDYLIKHVLNVNGWHWVIPPWAVFPYGLVLKPDYIPNSEGHFFLCPISDMPMDKYRGLLAEFALHCPRQLWI